MTFRPAQIFSKCGNGQHCWPAGSYCGDSSQGAHVTNSTALLRYSSSNYSFVKPVSHPTLGAVVSLSRMYGLTSLVIHHKPKSYNAAAKNSFAHFRTLSQSFVLILLVRNLSVAIPASARDENKPLFSYIKNLDLRMEPCLIKTVNQTLSEASRSINSTR